MDYTPEERHRIYQVKNRQASKTTKKKRIGQESKQIL